jgi:hypothetical protein
MQWGPWIRIRIQEGKNITHKHREKLINYIFEVLDVLCLGLKVSPKAWQFLIKKERKKNPFFLQFLVFKTLDLDWIRIRIRIHLKCWIWIRIQ